MVLSIPLVGRYERRADFYQQASEAPDSVNHREEYQADCESAVHASPSDKAKNRYHMAKISACRSPDLLNRAT